jgi:hypothetical protein
LVVIFALSAYEKWRVVRERRAAWHPVLLATGLGGSSAQTVLMLSFLADCILIATMFLPTSLGALLALSLLAGYTVAGWPVERAGQDCRCTGDWMVVRSTRMFLGRNLSLLIFALIAGPMLPFGLTSSLAIVGALSVGVAVAGSIRLSTWTRRGRVGVGRRGWRPPREMPAPPIPDRTRRREDLWSTK